MLGSESLARSYSTYAERNEACESMSKDLSKHLLAFGGWLWLHIPCYLEIGSIKSEFYAFTMLLFVPLEVWKK